MKRPEYHRKLRKDEEPAIEPEPATHVPHLGNRKERRRKTSNLIRRTRDGRRSTNLKYANTAQIIRHREK